MSVYKCKGWWKYRKEWFLRACMYYVSFEDSFFSTEMTKILSWVMALKGALWRYRHLFTLEPLRFKIHMTTKKIILFILQLLDFLVTTERYWNHIFKAAFFCPFFRQKSFKQVKQYKNVFRFIGVTLEDIGVCRFSIICQK